MNVKELPCQRLARYLGKSIAPFCRSIYFMPLIIFIVIVGAAIFGWQTAHNALSHDIAIAANTRASTVEQSIREKMISYEQILRGGVGLFNAAGEVTESNWKNYLDTFGIDNVRSGVQEVGFAKLVTANEPPISASQDNKQIGTDNNTYAAVLYAQSTNNGGSSFDYGFNMYSDPLRRASMLQARDIGKVTITPRLSLSSGSEYKTGFSMYAPYYEKSMPHNTIAARQAALRGYVYASFRADPFFRQVTNNTLAFQVTVDKNPDQALYVSPIYPHTNRSSQAVHITRPVELYGQTWKVDYAFNQNALISDMQLYRPLSVLLFGIFSAGLVATIVFLLMRSRSRDFNAQKDRAVELAKDELLSLASHQLRTPATGVKQYVGMVLQGFSGRVPVSQRKLLEKAYASNDRQLRIINEILHLAKIDSGRIVLAKQEANLSDLVMDIVNEQMPDIEDAQHRLKVVTPKKPVMVYADMHILRMAVENLLSNAVKYTPSGGRVKVRVSSDGEQARITIADSGIGIEPSDMHKVFRQFSRLQNEMSQHVGGTGIGLYLAKHLVELHAGTIEVKSTPGRGSTFTITLPTQKDTIKNLTVTPKT